MGDSNRYYGANAQHRSQIRAAFRAVSRQVQRMGTRVRELERTCDRLRDRATLPSPDQVRRQIGTKWQISWEALKQAEKSITDLFDLFY